jgi:hypothetical protein
MLFFALLIHDFKEYFTVFICICNFSLAALYHKDYNEVNYVGLLIPFFYFCKKFESCMLKGFKCDQTNDKIKTSMLMSVIVFNDEVG